jgi:hypothetical protein
MPNYVGSDILVKFKVLKDQKPANPFKANVHVYDPHNIMQLRGTPIRDGNIISYKLPGKYVKEEGIYNLIFNFWLTNLKVMQEHVIKVSVKHLPVPRNIEKREVARIAAL